VRAVGGRQVAEAIRADHNAVMEDDPGPDGDALPQVDPRMQDASGADLDAAADGDVAGRDRARTDLGPSPTTQNGPIETLSPTPADGATMALAWMPAAGYSAGWRIRPPVQTSSGGGPIGSPEAAHRPLRGPGSRRRRWSSLGGEELFLGYKNEVSGRSRFGAATRRISVSPSPSKGHPNRAASSLIFMRASRDHYRLKTKLGVRS